VVAVTARFILASASPARLRTLRAAGVDAEVMVSGVDESAVEADGPVSTCATLARRKAEAVLARVRQRAAGEGVAAFVLGCDSVLELGGEILGKPLDARDATRRWRQMRGASGVLHTGHCLVDAGTGAVAEGVGSTTVHFGDLTDAEIDAYVGTGEPLGVAGAFTIDGLGGWFVSGIDGDPGTVVGLSLPLLRQLLVRLGTRVHQLWPAALPSVR
jgi:septum formation protein